MEVTMGTGPRFGQESRYLKYFILTVHLEATSEDCVHYGYIGGHLRFLLVRSTNV